MLIIITWDKVFIIQYYLWENTVIAGVSCKRLKIYINWQLSAKSKTLAANVILKYEETVGEGEY